MKDCGRYRGTRINYTSDLSIESRIIPDFKTDCLLKMDQVGCFSYLGSIISKDGGSSEDVNIGSYSDYSGQIWL